MSEINEYILEAIRLYLEQSPTSIIIACEIADNYNISVTDLHNWFKYSFGVTIKQYHSYVKWKYFIDLIKTGHDNNSFGYARELGFSGTSGFLSFLKRMCGMSLAEIKSKVNAGEFEYSELMQYQEFEQVFDYVSEQNCD